MTAPDAPSPTTPGWPEQASPAPPPGIRAVDGNRAALALLVLQNLVAAIGMGIDLPLGGRTVHLGFNFSLGMSLLLSFVVVSLVAMTVFRPTTQALLRDTRWRTPPSWGVALAVFVLAFLASRAFALGFVTFFPETVGSMPKFLSQGLDLIVLLVAAGLLVPLAEEIAFRGLMMRGQERAAGFGVAAIASTVAFSVAHGVPASVAGIVPLAYAMARLVQHTGSLWNAVIVHALNNTFSVALGSALMGRNLGDPNEAAELLKNEGLRVPLALGALLFGAVVLGVLHLWLTPKADTQERSAPGPWVSGAYVVIVLFGLFTMLMTIPGLRDLLTGPSSLKGALP